MFFDDYDTAPFRFRLSGQPDVELRVHQFSAEESLCQPYRYIIDLISPDADLPIDNYIGERAWFDVYDENGVALQRSYSGIVAHCQQGDSGVQWTSYQVHLVADIKRLDYRSNCRIFQKQSVEDIIQQVLKDADIDRINFEITLSMPREPRVYCVQYRESDLNFITRLMEEEGIIYFFEHKDNSSQLIITDDPSRYPALPQDDRLLYHPKDMGLADQEHIHHVKWTESLTTNKVSLRDYDFKKPTLAPMEIKQAVEQLSDCEHYDYPGLYELPAQTGRLRAQVCLDRFQTGRRMLQGETTIRRLQPGHQFTLTDHPSDRFNRRYVIVDVKHTGNSPQTLGAKESDEGGDGHCYSHFSAIPVEVTYVAPHRAKRPSIDGVQTAIVVGLAQEEIYTDEHGRVKVQFHWDREGKSNEKSSCWVRVSQSWAGAGWGAIHIPRIGQEVVVSFEEGDPDRPIITGRTYHGDNTPPMALPSNKHKSGIISDSTSGGDGSNEFIFDDAKGKENITLHAEHNNTISVENDENHTVGVNRNKSIGANETVTVGTDRTETVGNNESITIGANRTENVSANETISVGENRLENVGGNESITIGGNQVETVQMNKAETIAIAKALSVGAAYQVSVGAAKNETVGLSSSEQVGIMKHIIAGKRFELVVGGSSLILNSDGTIILKGKDILIESGKQTTVKGKIVEIN
jgi:type VI secretion system secreted protein VgrG